MNDVRTRPNALTQALVLPACIVFSMAAATSGAFWPPDAWYFQIERPSWTPPGWLFGPVWTTLYVLIGVSLWRVWRTGGLQRDRTALGLFLAQWTLNLAWTGLFFGLHAPGLALVEIVLLAALILATIVRFHHHDRLAAWLLTPYLAWVCFATVLNAAFWWLNRA